MEPKLLALEHSKKPIVRNLNQTRSNLKHGNLDKFDVGDNATINT